LPELLVVAWGSHRFLGGMNLYEWASCHELPANSTFTAPYLLRVVALEHLPRQPAAYFTEQP
jgi:hypothetical protein